MAERDWDIVILHRATDLLQQAERIQRNFWQIAESARFRSSRGKRLSWEPPVNIVETGESFWVLVAIPGVTEERVAVTIEGSELIIAGERPLPACCNDGELQLWEIPLGHFERRIRLTTGGKAASIGKVSLQNGLLIIELRKQG
jgi:HSP20 family molecular chaperone IbpA